MSDLTEALDALDRRDVQLWGGPEDDEPEDLAKIRKVLEAFGDQWGMKWPSGNVQICEDRQDASAYVKGIRNSNNTVVRRDRFVGPWEDPS